MLEWELFFQPAGRSYLQSSLASKMPRLLAPIAFSMMRRHFERQLHGRGTARHAPEVVEAKDAPIWMRWPPTWRIAPMFLMIGLRPQRLQFSVWSPRCSIGRWTRRCSAYARGLPAITRYCELMRRRCFGKRADDDKAQPTYKSIIAALPKRPSSETVIPLVASE